MTMSKENLKPSATNDLNMNKNCAKLETKVRGREVSWIFQGQKNR